MVTYYGMNPPFIGGVQKVLSRQEDIQLIKNDVLQLLLTVPGERVYRPDFGSPLRSYVFETSTSSDLITLSRDIKQAINDYEPRVDIVSLDLRPTDDGKALYMDLVLSLRIDPKKVFTIQRFINSLIETQ